MTIRIKTKVLIKVEALMMMCVELKAKLTAVRNVYCFPHIVMWIAHTYTYRTHFKSQDLWLLPSRQRYWSNLELQMWYALNWELKCVPLKFASHALLISLSSHVQNTLQLCHQLTRVRIMTIGIKTKVMIKIGAPKMMRVELRTKMFIVCLIWTCEN